MSGRCLHFMGLLPEMRLECPDIQQVLGLNFYLDHNMIHTIVIHAYLYRIWSKALWLILTISTYCKFIDIECIPKIEMQM